MRALEHLFPPYEKKTFIVTLTYTVIWSHFHWNISVLVLSRSEVSSTVQFSRTPW